MREKNGVLRGQVSGYVASHGGMDDAMHHAFNLLDIAVVAEDEGCTPAGPPTRIAWDAPGPSARQDGSARFDDAATEPLRRALTRARPSRTCPPKP